MYKARIRSTTDNWNGKRTSASKISRPLPLRGCSLSGTSARILSPSPSHFIMLVFHSRLFIVQISTADNTYLRVHFLKETITPHFLNYPDLQVAAQSVPAIRHVCPLSRSHDPILVVEASFNPAFGNLFWKNFHRCKEFCFRDITGRSKQRCWRAIWKEHKTHCKNLL